jgi:hypothetical protein
MGLIEPKFDANRLKGGSTGFIKDMTKKRKAAFDKQQKPILKDLEKQRQDIKDAPIKAAKKRSEAAKKGAATRKANREAAKNAPAPTKTFNPLKKATVSGQTGGAKGKPAAVGTTPVKASKPAAMPKTPSGTKRTPPAKGVKPAGAVPAVTKKPQRGRPR